MAEAGIPARIMIDFSHAQQQQESRRSRSTSAQDVARQLAAGDDRICGVMAESHLKAGRQDLVPGKPLAYGVSITDGCIGWEESRGMLDVLAEGVRKRRIKAEADAQ